jgi:hypothetical protein
LTAATSAALSLLVPRGNHFAVAPYVASLLSALKYFVFSCVMFLTKTLYTQIKHMALLNVGKGDNNGYLMTYYHDLRWTLRAISNRYPKPPSTDCGILWEFNDHNQLIENSDDKVKFQLFEEIRQAFYTCIISIYQVYNQMHNQTDAYLQTFFSDLHDRYQVTSSQWWKMLEQKQKMIQSCVVELFVLVCKMVQQHESWEGTTMAKFTPFPLKSFNGQEMHWTQMCIELPKDDRISQKSLKPVANANTLPPVVLSNGEVSSRARRPPLFLVGAAEQPTDPKIAVLFAEGAHTWVRMGGANKKGWCELHRELYREGKEPTPLETTPERAMVKDICEWKLTKGTMTCST